MKAEQAKWEYRVEDAFGYTTGSIGWNRLNGTGRVSHQIERILNRLAAKGFELDRIEQERSDHAIVVMRRKVGEGRTAMTNPSGGQERMKGEQT